MKNFHSLYCLLLLVLGISSCTHEDALVSSDKVQWRANQNSIIFPPNAHPYGKSYEEWALEIWEPLLEMNCEELFTQEALDLDNNVIALKFFYIDNEDFNVTVPSNTGIFVSLSSILWDYPCPFEGFEPAPGQTLEEFLIEGAHDYVEGFENVEAEFDGISIDLSQLLFYTDVFTFTANADLTSCFDPCITGTPQPGIVGGWFAMFKPMQPGTHTLHISGEYPAYEYYFEKTINITVE